MALNTVGQLKDDVAGMLSGIDITQISNLNRCLQRAFTTQLQKADIPEASGIQNITLYSGVFNYLCNPSIYGTAITDIRPEGVSRNPNNQVIKTNQEDFDRTKNYQGRDGTMSTFEYNNGVPTIRIVAPFPKQMTVLDPMNQIGGWTVGGVASNLVQDTTVFYQSPASLRMNLGTGTGNLTETINAINLSTYQGVGVAFIPIFIPSTQTATNLTSITLEIGSDSGDYSSVTNTTGFLGAWQSGNWLLVPFDFSTATNTGTPNWTAITYLNVIFNTSGTITNFRTGGLWISFPTQAQILFQSAAIFLPVGSNTPLTTITLDSDTIILTDPAYNIYQYECAISVCQESGGASGSATVEGFEAVLNGSRTRTGVVISLGLYDIYRGRNPTQQLAQVGSYYSNGRNYGSLGTRRY